MEHSYTPYILDSPTRRYDSIPFGWIGSHVFRKHGFACIRTFIFPVDYHLFRNWIAIAKYQDA